MLLHTRFLHGWLALTAMTLIPALAYAGDLTPPGGPVAPTMKNLLDVEPRMVIRNDTVPFTPIVISAPGSYYLGEDIQALPARHGIEITASDVTLDLNGFTIRGNLEVGSLDGIHVTGDRMNIAIFNGNIRSFLGHGVNASTADTTAESMASEWTTTATAGSGSGSTPW